MKIFIATPAYKGEVTAAYAASLMEVGQDCASHGIELSGSIIKNGIFIEKARSVACKNFLETDCTHLFFIDADLGFDGRFVRELASVGLPFTAGVYRKRQDEVSFNAQFDDPQYAENPGQRASWVSAVRVAAGFMCLERNVIEAMSNVTWSVDDKGNGIVPMVFQTRYEGVDERKFIGEDYCFCDDYMRLYRKGVFEHPIWVWPDITFNHDGYVGNFHEEYKLESDKREDDLWEAKMLGKYAPEKRSLTRELTTMEGETVEDAHKRVFPEQYVEEENEGSS
jgi:hypothetical protein